MHTFGSQQRTFPGSCSDLKVLEATGTHHMAVPAVRHSGHREWSVLGACAMKASQATFVRRLLPSSEHRQPPAASTTPLRVQPERDYGPCPANQYQTPLRGTYGPNRHWAEHLHSAPPPKKSRRKHPFQRQVMLTSDAFARSLCLPPNARRPHGAPSLRTAGYLSVHDLTLGGSALPSHQSYSALPSLVDLLHQNYHVPTDQFQHIMLLSSGARATSNARTILIPKCSKRITTIGEHSLQRTEPDHTVDKTTNWLPATRPCNLPAPPPSEGFSINDRTLRRNCQQHQASNITRHLEVYTQRQSNASTSS